MTRHAVRARVRVLVEIPVSSHWDDGVKAEQVRSQATEDAIGALRNGLVIDGLKANGASYPHHATIVGTPKVEAILVDLDEKTS